MNFFQPIQDNPNASVETLEKQRVSWNKGLKGTGLQCCHPEGWAPNKGRKHTAESRARMSAAQTARHKIAPFKHTAESRAKLSAALKGKKRRPNSAETCAKKSAALKGKPNPLARKVMTYYGVYASIGQVMLAANVTSGTVRGWMKKYPEHYFYLEA